MKNIAEKQPQTPPGVIATLTAGFELTTGHIWLILLPLALDLFYWLGPRVAIEKLFSDTLEPLLNQPAAQEAASQLIELAAGINVLTTLSVPLIGIPTLMGGVVPEQTPMPAQVYEIDSMFLVLIMLVGLSLTGLLLATIYLSLISRTLQEPEYGDTSSAGFILMVLICTFRLFVLALLFLLFLVMVWLVLLPVAFVVGLLAMELAVYVMFAGFVVVAIYLSMSVPGIVLNGRPVFKSILESARLVHRNAMQTTLMLLAVFLVSSGTNRLWRLADDGSWLTLVSIAGHAFISTALATAFFVFYRDRWSIAQDRVTAR